MEVLRAVQLCKLQLMLEFSQEREEVSPAYKLSGTTALPSPSSPDLLSSVPWRKGVLLRTGTFEVSPLEVIVWDWDEVVGLLLWAWLTPPQWETL